MKRTELTPFFQLPQHAQHPKHVCIGVKKDNGTSKQEDQEEQEEEPRRTKRIIYALLVILTVICSALTVAFILAQLMTHAEVDDLKAQLLQMKTSHLQVIKQTNHLTNKPRFIDGPNCYNKPVEHFAQDGWPNEIIHINDWGSNQLNATKECSKCAYFAYHRWAGPKDLNIWANFIDLGKDFDFANKVVAVKNDFKQFGNNKDSRWEWVTAKGKGHTSGVEWPAGSEMDLDDFEYLPMPASRMWMYHYLDCALCGDDGVTPLNASSRAPATFNNAPLACETANRQAI